MTEKENINPAGGTFADFLDELGNRDEIYRWVIETLESEANPKQLENLRKLLERNPPWTT